MARKSRRSRKDQWSQMRENLPGVAGKSKGVENREYVPEKACGKCKSFSTNAYASDGSGFCKVLKMGSDIMSDKPIFIFEGDASLMSSINMDADKCEKYAELTYIDTDNTECADPARKRTGRQMSKAANN